MMEHHEAPHAQLEDRDVVIVGGASAIGRAMARAFAAAGSRVLAS